MNNKDLRLDLFLKLEPNPNYTQRKFPQEMMISLSMVNYCMQKLTESVWLKLTNFSRSSNILRYMKLLVHKGTEQKVRHNLIFNNKVGECEILNDETSKLKLDVEEMAKEK